MNFRFNDLSDIRNLFVVLFSVLVVVHLAELLDRPRAGISYFVLTEWAINYSTGFVRRGLSGEFVVWANQLFELKYESFVAVIAYTTYFLIVLYSLWHIIRLKNSLSVESVAILLFLPTFLVFPILEPSALGRKENLFILLLIGHIQWLNANTRWMNEHYKAPGEKQRILRNYALVATLLFNAVGIPVALMHEGFLILSVPVNMLLTYSFLRIAHGAGRSIFLSICIYAPVIVVSLFIFSGMAEPESSRDRVLAICEGFAYANSIECDDRKGAIGALLQTPYQALWQAYKYNYVNGEIFGTYVVLMGLNFLLAACAGVGILTARLRESLGTDGAEWMAIKLTGLLLVLPTIATGPLYAVGLDWGRWTAIPITSFLICCLGLSRIEVAAGLVVGNGNHGGPTTKGSSFKEGRVTRSIKGVVVLAAVYTLTSTSLPICCIDSTEDVEEKLTNGTVTHFVRQITRM